jgi:hypothetical protein
MRERAVAALLPAAILGYAVVALAIEHWWLSGVVALVVAGLMWRRHPRARFSAYILLSALVMRAVFGHAWGALVFAALTLAVMQTPAARRAWPRLVPGARPGRGARPEGGDRMARP